MFFVHSPLWMDKFLPRAREGGIRNQTYLYYYLFKYLGRYVRCTLYILYIVQSTYITSCPRPSTPPPHPVPATSAHFLFCFCFCFCRKAKRSPMLPCAPDSSGLPIMYGLTRLRVLTVLVLYLLTYICRIHNLDVIYLFFITVTR